MERGMQGRWETTILGGEVVRAFVPMPLPPDPPLEMDAELTHLLERASLAVGRLDGLATLLPDVAVPLYFFVRKEAVLSSQIEGTQSSLSDLLLFESEQVPGVPMEDVREVSTYVAALEAGLARLPDLPLSTRLLCEVHAVLLSHGRGSTSLPGSIRRSQNWIGGTRPGNAHFVPPPPHLLGDCLTELERTIHGVGTFQTDICVPVPTLVKAALIHAQFETIHPFLDGNGRLGRMLITLLLCAEGVLQYPLLYLSLYFRKHRRLYYELLDRTRFQGDWEAWVRFFLEGVVETADQGAALARGLLRLYETDRYGLERTGANATVLRVLDAFQKHPVRSVATLAESLGLTAPTVRSAIVRLESDGIVREFSGRKRDRAWVYSSALALLESGGEARPAEDS